MGNNEKMGEWDDPTDAGWQSAIQPGLRSEEATSMKGLDWQTGQCMARGRGAA
ncbi:MAG: hypothetical protein ABL949_17215 [Fimbriimonadaceae bacterium]